MSEKSQEVATKLCNVITQAELTTDKTIEVISIFLYSLGNSIEKCDHNLTPKEVLMLYAKKPTFGNALMAQALYMKETWPLKES